MKKETCMIIKNALTGECFKVPKVEDLSASQRNAIIEAYTEKMTNNDIGYYISYMYEV